MGQACRSRVGAYVADDLFQVCGHLAKAAVGIDLGADGVEVRKHFGVAERHAAVVNDLTASVQEVCKDF
jgi:hypothetical protein